MRIWNLINPSDPYTCTGDDPMIVMLAVILLSPHIGIEEVGVETDKPETYFFSPFGGDPTVRFKETFGEDVDDLLTGARRQKTLIALADVYESVVYGSLSQRRTYEKGLALIDDEAKRVAWRDAWHDQRSSMNDIGGAAYAAAKRIRETLAAEAEVV